jgi:hypothetical protein
MPAEAGFQKLFCQFKAMRCLFYAGHIIAAAATGDVEQVTGHRRMENIAGLIVLRFVQVSLIEIVSRNEGFEPWLIS